MTSHSIETARLDVDYATWIALIVGAICLGSVIMCLRAVSKNKDQRRRRLILSASAKPHRKLTSRKRNSELENIEMKDLRRKKVKRIKVPV